MEYEYSFVVSDLSEYINYCGRHSYALEGHKRQLRTIYVNNDIIARITQNIFENKNVNVLDFKENKMGDSDLIIRQESKSIVFDNVDSCENILNFLGYKKDQTLDRIRTIYVKGNVKFEIDEYALPYKAFVVAVEGEKDAVDEVYKSLSDLNAKYKIK